MVGRERRLPAWCAGDEWCPITCTSAILGKKWHPVIIDRLLEDEALGFNALKERIDGVSSKVLSQSLEDLEEKQLVEREIVSEKPFRVEYSLTEYGRGLEPVIDEMFEWGKDYLVETDDRQESII
jgi:DNA-binding HxlR family transcriptional regulator